MDRQLIHLLRQLNSGMRGAFSAGLAELNLTPQQVTVLHLIDATPDSSPAELARYANVKPQTMHKLVTDLERRELISLRPRSGHGRILDANLTTQGREHLTAADVQAQAMEDRMTADLDQRQYQQLVQLLKQCVTALGMQPDDGSRRDIAASIQASAEATE